MESIAVIYTSWLSRRGLNPKEAAALIGCAVSTSYEYANGESVPPGTRVAAFARAIEESPVRIAKVAARDRQKLRRAHTKTISRRA